jgi:hypothetical protein
MREIDRIREAYAKAGKLHLLNIALLLNAQPNIRIWDDDYGTWHITHGRRIAR